MAQQLDFSTLSINQIATLIRRTWTNVNYAAKPYLDAMSCFNSVNDSYGMDTGKSVVLYFLCNASSYRGETARQVKRELNKRVK
jgi:hypothetical protein